MQRLGHGGHGCLWLIKREPDSEDSRFETQVVYSASHVKQYLFVSADLNGAEQTVSKVPVAFATIQSLILH